MKLGEEDNNDITLVYHHKVFTSNMSSAGFVVYARLSSC